MALRSTYGSGEYASGLYGEPETTQAAASASMAVSATSSSVTVISASASTAVAIASSQPTAIRVADAAADVSLGGVVSVSAVKYEVVPGFRSGYGGNTFGTYVYGKNISIEEASASAAIAFSATASAQVTRNVAAAPTIAVSAVTNAVIDVVGAATPTVSISTNIVYNRVRLMAAADNFDITAEVSARYKWLDAADPTTSWTPADYLERAA
jgi:Golgi nucleoside diphosphatase